MNIQIKNLLVALLVGACLDQSLAQTNVTLTTLYSFSTSSPGNTNGYNPDAGLMQGTDGSFYGTTGAGGKSGSYGTAYRVAANGTFTTLALFSGTNGTDPRGALVQGGDGYFYGTTFNGGNTNNRGTVFKMATNGTITSLYANFTSGTNGANPQGDLLFGNDGYFYGACSALGDPSLGTIFKISTNGTLSTLHAFNNSGDGFAPIGPLAQRSDGDFNGITASGTIFRMTNSTGGIRVLTNGTGGNAGIIKGLDGNFYGATVGGQSGDSWGRVFKISTNDVITTVFSFGGTNGSQPATLLQNSDGNLYGSTTAGGTGFNVNASEFGYYTGLGTVFKLTTNGVLTTLVRFNGTNGSSPRGLMLAADGSLYGATHDGGTNSSNNGGTIFRLTFSQTAVTLTNLIVSPANATISVGSNLQFTATKFFSDGSSQVVTNDGTNSLWSSSIPSVASITTNGVATGLAQGSTTIFATSGSISNSISLTVVVSPVIVTQPTNNTVFLNGNVTLTVGATGGGLSYQWRLNGTNISGATGASYTISNMAPTNVGVYTVIISNLAGSVTSQPAIVGTIAIQMFAGVIVNGPLGTNYVIKSSTDLSNWTTLTNVALPSQPYIFIDYSTPYNPHNNYQAIPQ